MLFLSSVGLFACGCKTCWTKPQEARTEVPGADLEMGDPAQRSAPPPEQSSLIEDQGRGASKRL